MEDYKNGLNDLNVSLDKQPFNFDLFFQSWIYILECLNIVYEKGDAANLNNQLSQYFYSNAGAISLALFSSFKLFIMDSPPPYIVDDDFFNRLKHAVEGIAPKPDDIPGPLSVPSGWSTKGISVFSSTIARDLSKVSVASQIEKINKIIRVSGTDTTKPVLSDFLKKEDNWKKFSELLNHRKNEFWLSIFVSSFKSKMEYPLNEVIRVLPTENVKMEDYKKGLNELYASLNEQPFNFDVFFQSGFTS